MLITWETQAFIQNLWDQGFSYIILLTEFLVTRTRAYNCPLSPPLCGYYNLSSTMECFWLCLGTTLGFTEGLQAF